MDEAKQLARKYKALTGKPLGITSEVGEFAAATLLGLELCQARQEGYDAIRIENEKEIRVQIKSRCLPPNAKKNQRIGRIDKSKEWDTVALVLLDSDMEPMEIYEAERQKIIDALEEPGSKARNERGALGVSKFKSIGKRVWEKSQKAIE